MREWLPEDDLVNVVLDLSLHEVGHLAASTLIEAVSAGGVEPGVQRVTCHVVPRESTAPA